MSRNNKSNRTLISFAEVWELLRPCGPAMAMGLVLVCINRCAYFVLPYSSKLLVDDVITRHHPELLGRLVLMVIAATVVQAATSLGIAQSLSASAQRLIAQLRQRLQAHITSLPVTYHNAHKAGTLLSRIMDDAEGVRYVVGAGIMEFVGGLVISAVAFVMLLRINLLLTGFMLVLALLFVVGFRRALSKVRPAFLESARINAEVTGRLAESLGGVRVVKSYDAEDQEAKVFSAGMRRLLEKTLKTVRARSFMVVSTTLAMGCGSALIMFFGARQIAAGMLTLGQLITFTMLVAFFVTPLLQIVDIGIHITEAFVGLERVRDVLKEPREHDDPCRIVSMEPLSARVSFENVYFSYDGQKTVLKDISFDAPPGTITALVGPSGAGKSTIIALLAGFYSPTSGVVRVDGIDLSTVKLASYRSQLGVVLQESFLFDGSIRENVAFSRPNAGESEIMEACRIAHVHEFAQSSEKGYDTVVGERGIKLSGGQRQRISIARAILAAPQILLLDEATSSLDSESEAAIQKALAQLMPGRTTFIIAHRLSTIRHAHQILMLDKGQIIERGTHDFLYAARGRYYEMYRQQHHRSKVSMRESNGLPMSDSRMETELFST